MQHLRNIPRFPGREDRLRKSPLIPLFQSGRQEKENLESYDKKLKERSRTFRESMTDAEKLLWSKLRMRQIHDLIFYRQKPIGEYIADFYCPKAKLVIEVDGGQHYSDDGIEYDKTRDEYLSGLGLRILRFANADVLGNIEGVLKSVENTVLGKNPP
jgi:very-short-patch-repair endonuclease